MKLDMSFKKIVLSKIFLFFLTSLSFLSLTNLWGQQGITEEELYRLEKMANDMLAQLSPEEREQALAMAQQMEQEIAQLPPEKLMEVEAALKQDMQYLLSEDSPYKQFGNDPVPPANQPEYPAPELPELPESQELDQKPGPQKIKPKTVDPVKVQTIKLLLQNIIRNLDELLIKAQSLPKVSPDRAHESSWQILHLEIIQLKSILAIVSEKPALIAQLLAAKFSGLYSNLQKLNKALSESTRKLPVLKKLDTIIDQLIELELSQTRAESQKLVKEFAPEALSEFTPVGNKWHHADHGQQTQRAQKIQEKHNLKPSGKQKKAVLAPHKLADQLTQELTNLQNLIQDSQLIAQIENLAKNTSFNNSSEKTTLRQLEADLIRVNLQYERLLRALISVVGKSYQLAPQLVELMQTKVGNANGEINKVRRLVSSTLAAEFELAEQIKKQLLKLEAQASELSDKIAILVPAKTGPEVATVKNLVTKPGKAS